MDWGQGSRVAVPGGWEVQIRRWGDGEPLVLLHGFTGSTRSWPVDAVSVLAREYSVVAMDLPGHGESSIPTDPGRYSFAHLIDDLAFGLDEAGVGPAHVLGYSMGGRVALGLALSQPGRADEALAEGIEANGMEWFVDRWTRIPLFASQNALPESVRADLRARRLACSRSGLAFSLRVMGTGVQPSFWGRLEELISPTLLLAGALDPKFRSIGQRMEAQLPDASLEVVPNAGHAIHLENPRGWSGAVLKFLEPPDRETPQTP
jgi:2-succinyl-6-hydroxy-2,4-cyclohexadiene-1-carboxylate synthase